MRVASVAGYAANETNVASVSANRATNVDHAIQALTMSQIRGTLTTEGNRPAAGWKVFADLDLDANWDENEPMGLTDSQGRYSLPVWLRASTRCELTCPQVGATPGVDSNILVSLSANAVSASNDFTLRPTNASVSGGVHFVTIPSTTVESATTLSLRFASHEPYSNGHRLRLNLGTRWHGCRLVKGMIAWRPTIDQVGAHDVIIRATDSTGSIALHSFRIDVASPDSNPVIIANPSLKAYVGRAYIQDLAAQDAEEGPLTWSIINGPVGSVIDSVSGRLTWTPSIGDVGQIQFNVAAKDSKGNQSTTSFSLDVVSDAPSLLPLSIQLPRNSARAGSEYRSQIRASDAIGRPVTWTLAAGPSGLVVSPEGNMLWTPSSDEHPRQFDWWRRPLMA